MSSLPIIYFIIFKVRTIRQAMDTLDVALHMQYLQNQEVIYFSIVEKDSEKGFTTNKRVLIMLQYQYICYLSQPKIENNQFTHQYIREHAKMIVPLQQITKIKQKKLQKKFSIQFWVQENDRKVDKSWTISVGSEVLWRSWVELFEDYTTRSRNFTLQNKNSNSDKKLTKPIGYQPNTAHDNSNQNMIRYDANLSSASNNNMQVFNTAPITPNHHHQQLSDVKPGPSYSSNPHLISFPNYTQPYKDSYPLQQQENAISISNSSVKNRSMYFTNRESMNTPLTVKVSFKNYYIPYIDGLLAKDFYVNNKINVLNTINHQFNLFLEYARTHVVNLIDYKASSIQGMLQGNNWLKYQEMQDINIELGLTEMKNIKNDHFVCDDSLNKLAHKNFKNLEYLYSVIKKDKELSSTFFIPMMCIIKYKGFKCFVTSKILPEEDLDFQPTITKSQRNTSKLFDQLSAQSKIDLQIFQKEQYIKIIPKNHRKDKFIITSANVYLPQLDNCLPIRRQAFVNIFTDISTDIFNMRGSKKELQTNKQRIKAYQVQKISDLAEAMNKLLVFPLSPSEFSQILHLYGINIKHLGILYNQINQFYAQTIIKTEAAIRSFKVIFNKKIQESGNNVQNPSYCQQSARQLINTMLGLGQTSDQLWKIVSLHCQLYFSLSIDRSQINKGYLLLGLILHLNIQPSYSNSLVQNLFKTNNYLSAVKFRTKTKCPNILPEIMNILKEQYDHSANENTFNDIIMTFQLGTNQIPNFIKHYPYIYSKLISLLSFFIEPKNTRYQHLNIYSAQIKRQYQKIVELNIFSLSLRIIQVKWMIKNGQASELILLLLARIKETVQNYYGKFHPSIEEIYEIESIYYLQNFKEEKAIQASKESLSNMIQCCGNNNKHLKISNNYYQLAECYKKCHRFQQAVTNYKKSKNLLQINYYQQNPEYAHILYKLGSMYLLHMKDNESYEFFVYALYIYESHNLLGNWSLIVEILDAIHRCDIKANTVKQLPMLLQDSRLAEHCLSLLQQVLSAEAQYEICNQRQFIIMLKIIVQQYIGLLRREQKHIFRAYIINMNDKINTTFLQQKTLTQSQSISYFQSLIIQGKFSAWMQNFILRSTEILLRIDDQKRIGLLIPHRRNELIQNYDQFMRNLILVLDQAFIINIAK